MWYRTIPFNVNLSSAFFGKYVCNVSGDNREPWQLMSLMFPRTAHAAQLIVCPKRMDDHHQSSVGLNVTSQLLQRLGSCES